MTSNDNYLVQGESRSGQLIINDDRTPDTQALLELTDNSIKIVLSWVEGAAPYDRWFGSSVMYSDDPDKKRYAYQVSENLWFQDNKGRVALLDCRGRSLNSNMGNGLATAIIVARTAILGAHVGVDYSRINGLRSSITGLRQWVNQSSLSTVVKYNEGGRVEELDYTLHSPQDIRLSEAPDTGLTFLWHEEKHGDVTEIHDECQVESFCNHLCEWDNLERYHRAVRDLLNISSWRVHDRSVTQVLRTDDPKLLMNGKPYQENWCHVVRSGQNEHALPKRINYLIQYVDLKDDGFKAWFELWDKFSRAIDPFVSSLDLQRVTIEVQVAQCGIGLEALGYLLYLEDGEGVKKANGHCFKDRLLRIAKDLGSEFTIDTDAWAQKMTAAYNGIKHANRASLDAVDNANAWRESVLVFRGWIALRLGVTHQTLKDRIKRDPMINAYIAM
jgi:hypothetical protein